MNTVNQGLGHVTVLPTDTWKRSTRLQGGYWQGSLTLRGHINDLIGPFYDWLGYHLNERTGATTTWEGMIYEMELAVGGSRRKRTLDLLYNAVQATYTTMDFAGDNLIANAGFESAGGGGADVFTNWTEGTGVASSGSSPHGGAACCQITSDGVQDPNLEGHFTNAYIRQNIHTQAGIQYRLTWWHRGSGNWAGWYSVRNPNAPTGWAITPRPAGWPATDWYRRSAVFTGPSGGEALIYFYPPPESGHQAGYDDVELLEKTEVVYETGWALNDQSLARYGRREDFLEIDNYPKDTADAFRDTYLNEHAWPWPRPLGVGPKGDAVLTIQACGYVFTGNWLFAKQGDDEEHDLDHWISQLIGSTYGLSEDHGGTVDGAGDCEFLRTGNIASNSTKVVERIEGRDRAWDLIMEMVALGDDQGTPWRAWVGPGRLVHYQPIDLTPQYYYRGDGLYESVAGKAEINPWQIRPGVVRDLNYPVRRIDQGSPFDDARDSLIDEVEVAADGSVSLSCALFAESDIYSSQYAIRDWSYDDGDQQGRRIIYW